MDEERLIELLARKLAGEASPEELEQLGDLITRNPEAIRTYDIINQIWKEKSEEKSSENYFARHRIKYQHLFEISDDNLIEGEARNGKNNKPKYLAGSLIAIVLLFTTAYLFLKAPEVKRLITNTEIISGKGVRKSVTLPDGTTVWINADSRISFDPHMNEREERMVELVGEAYFDVVHIADHPFIIHTSKVSIKVLGTAFNIKAYPDDNKCETTLIRGAIELSTNNSLKQKFTLRPSEKLSVINYQINEGTTSSKHYSDSATLLIENIAPVKLADKEYVSETSWTENKLIFENESLANLVPQLERWFNVQITLSGKTIAGERFTGVFANETIEQALTAMKLIKPFNFIIDEKKIRIY